MYEQVGNTVYRLSRFSTSRHKGRGDIVVLDDLVAAALEGMGERVVVVVIELWLYRMCNGGRTIGRCRQKRQWCRWFLGRQK